MPEVTNPIIIGLALAMPATAISLLGLRRAYHNDKITEQSGIVTGNTEAISQVIGGLNGIIDSLQEDNKIFREEMRLLNVRLEIVVKERNELRKELDQLHRKYGDEGP